MIDVPGSTSSMVIDGAVVLLGLLVPVRIRVDRARFEDGDAHT